ncbi:ATP-binding protein [Asticcacaulis sp. AND118]|uniref:ATP-binding protein n=1 Tax=Asticcacaulis sp. AND118 TaxID=2840468 RepID=UPI001D00163A|nr:ATP-binding protein [Asticcacaulis sp. AND118]UDF03828.1 sensor histidine kinase [Asticcacaulis sp. AND118]
MQTSETPQRRIPLPPFTRIGFFRARLGRLILLLNLAGLLVLVIGALVLNEFRQGLIDNRKESLMAQAETMGEIIAYVATAGDPEPYLSAQDAVQPLARFIPPEQRARLFDGNGQVLTDSYTVSELIDVRALPPVNESRPTPEMRQAAGRKQEAAREALETEVRLALTGERVASVRYNERGEKVVSVSVPIRRVKAILGVLTLEAGDVDAIVAAQRWAMLPFILVALGVSLFSSLLLHWLVSRPIHRLSDAADAVRMQKARTFSLPDLESRSDEVGILARSLQSMTEALQKRMDEIDRFAADVSHEIKNPLTSIRSALETLNLVKDEAAKARLMAVIQQDVRRADRLITDISNASRLDAELARDVPRPVDVGALLDDIVSLYQHMPDGVAVSLSRNVTPAASKVMGREGPLGQVFRNIIDNARSFSPEGGTVRVTVAHSDADPARPLQIVVEDDGPGIPAENLETIFQRFYTSRPKGTDFGRNSGLGLSISRQIIEAQGGRVWAENRTDADGAVAGARFTIALPNVYQ